MFIEFRYKLLTFDDHKWEEFVNKWNLKNTTENQMCSAHTEDYLICITGESLKTILKQYSIRGIEKYIIDEPTDFVILTISHKIEMKRMLYFLDDFFNIIGNAEELKVVVHAKDIGETIHPDWLVKKMIENLGNS